jgi:hypothetical protein
VVQAQSKNYSSHRHDVLHFNNQIATYLAFGLPYPDSAWQTHGRKRHKKIARKEKVS